jgi:glycosyltransferase involved in cell wall biosynthesis
VLTEKKLNISAIVPLFNGEQFISEALESLLSQTHPIDEIIIIDDKSTDQSLEKVQKLIETNETIKLLKNSSNKGSSHCRNLGIKESSGDYVLFLDQDDYLAPSFIDETNNHLNQHRGKEVAGLHTSYFIVDEKGEITAETSYKEIQPEEFLGYQFVRNRILSNSGTVVKKSVLEQTGFYDESLKFSQDWDLCLRIGKLGMFSYLKKPLTHIRRHSNNTSSKIDGFLSDERTILQKYDLEFIRQSIDCRKLSAYENEMAFLSILHRLGSLGKLELELSKTKKSHPEHSDHHFYKGLINHQAGNLVEAIKSFGKIRPQSEYFQPALNNMAALHILANDLEKAVELLSKITSERPDYQDAMSNQMLACSENPRHYDPIITTRPLREALYSYG